MKKRILAVLVAVMMVLCMLASCEKKTVEELGSETVTVKFVYGDANIEKNLSADDIDFVRDIIEGKTPVKDNPSCAFTEKVSITFDDCDRQFQVACDDCPILYDVKEGRYIHIEDTENAALRALLERYGFVFPCV